MLIRQMEREDCEQVQTLFSQCFSDPWSLESVEEMFEVEGYYSLVAQEGEKLCGYIGIKTVLDEADIVNVAVLPEYRGKRIATTLLETLLEDAEKDAIHAIYLEVREHNVPAISLYKQAGFTPNGLRKNYYDNPKEHAILMMWEKRELC